MIAAVRGTLEGKTLDSALVMVGGVTLRVQTPLNTLAQLTTGEAVHLHTHLFVREDILALYGFATLEDRSTFEQLLGVGGVGPRIALAMLSTLSAGGIQEAVLTEDINRLSMTPGVGKKLAARLVLELRPRFEKLGPLPVGAGGTSSAVAMAGSIRAQAVEALTGLGYPVQQASAAVRAVPDDPDLRLEGLITRALRSLASE
jgi:holliday junction DNA helicase RuvA